eukprot:266384-Pelagomonas_calceolata.AAC.2
MMLVFNGAAHDGPSKFLGAYLWSNRAELPCLLKRKIREVWGGVDGWRFRGVQSNNFRHGVLVAADALGMSLIALILHTFLQLHDVLVATDAVGMGLNLNIRRIVFTALNKSTGNKTTAPLKISDIKQIAGRAGRRGTRLELACFSREHVVSCGGGTPTLGMGSLFDWLCQSL